MRNRLSPLHPAIWKAVRRKRGQTLVEYGLITVFISVLAIAVLTALGEKVKSVYTTIDSQLGSAQAGGSSGSGGSGSGSGSGGTGGTGGGRTG